MGNGNRPPGALLSCVSLGRDLWPYSDTQVEKIYEDFRFLPGFSKQFQDEKPLTGLVKPNRPQFGGRFLSHSHGYLLAETLSGESLSLLKGLSWVFT